VLGDHPIHQRGHLGLVGHVGLDRLRGIDLLGHQLRGLGVAPIVDDHVIAQPAQLNRGRGPDSPAGSADECHLPVVHPSLLIRRTKTWETLGFELTFCKYVPGS
jgi:hypothetical protein